MKVKRVILIISVIIISVWMFQLYRNRCLTVEYYSNISEGLRDHINDRSNELDPLYVMNTFVQLTEDDEIVQEALDSAELDDRRTLTLLLERVEKKK